MSALQVKEHPLLLSDEMVRAVLNGKSQTRRPITPENIRFFDGRGNSWKPGKEQLAEALTDAFGFRYLGATCWTWKAKAYEYQNGDHTNWMANCKWAPGDRLWVREAWCQNEDFPGIKGNAFVHFRADGHEVYQHDGDGFIKWKKDGNAASPWKASIHMPRWASRITLDVTKVRIERIQDICEMDALAEGAKLQSQVSDLGDGRYLHCSDKTYKAGFQTLWESVYPGSWKRNDHVFVLDFKRVENV